MICKICKKEIIDKFNFCPNCGNPITEISRKIENTKKVKEIMHAMIDIVSKIDDQKTLAVINKYIEDLKKTL